MKRSIKVICLMIALCVLLALAACGGQPAPGNSDPQTPPAGNDPNPSQPDPSQPSQSTDGPDLGAYSADNPLVIRMATMDNRSDNPITNGNGIIIGDKFKELIEAALGDCVSVTFYTDGAMGADGEIFESVCAGTLEMSDTLSSTLAGYADEFKVLDLPYLFEGDWPHLLAFVGSSVATDLAATLNTHMNKAICLGIKANGPRNVSNNTRPVSSVDDLRGLNLRVQSAEIYTKAFEAFGAVPVPMSGGELFTALQQGTVDGEENNAVTDYSIGLSGLTKYYTETRHIQMFSTMCCNAAWYNSLTPDLQKIVSDCVTQACVEASEIMQEKNETCIDGIETEFGNELVRYKDADIQSFIDASASVYESYRSSYGSEWIDAIQGLSY